VNLRIPLVLILIGSIIVTSCSPKTCVLEPSIIYFPQERHIKKLPPCFPPLTREEQFSDWGKELLIGNHFAHELDLYRAITSYKRALILIPHGKTERRLQLHFCILSSYYLGGKFPEVIEEFQSSGLMSVPEDFPAFRELMIILYDSYQQNGDELRASAILNLLKKYDPEAARDLSLGTSILNADLTRFQTESCDHPDAEKLSEWLEGYTLEAKSPKKAQFLNAVLPGAGYYYVGQTKTAFTSFVINALFLAATIQLGMKGYVAPAIITGSLEMGWYLGGINGAGLAAKEYNEILYSKYGKEIMLQEKLFPVLMFNCAF
jgi:hypothetical protein